MAGCSEQIGGDQATTPPQTVAEPTPSVAQTAPPEPEPEPEYNTFDGPGFTYDDGLHVALGGLEQFVPTEFAAFEEAPAYVRFTVTITNGTGQPFDPSTAYVTVSSGGAEAGAVFDAEQGLEGAPLTPVLPGASVSWMEGFAVTDPADLVCQIAPSFDHAGELFVGGL